MQAVESARARGLGLGRKRSWPAVVSGAQEEPRLRKPCRRQFLAWLPPTLS